MTHFQVTHDSFKCDLRLIHLWPMTHSSANLSFQNLRVMCVCVYARVRHVCVYVRWSVRESLLQEPVFHDSFIRDP